MTNSVILQPLKVFLGIAILVSLVACASTHQNRTENSTAETSNVSAGDKWGIQLESIRLTAAGYMIDLRYRVTDPETAAPLLNRGIKRYVIVERSGAVLRIPETEKLGALRSTVSVPEMVKRDRVYGALFANPGRHVKQGDRVTVVLGDFRAENLTVN